MHRRVRTARAARLLDVLGACPPGADAVSPGPPDWPLIRQIIRVVHAAPGGGLHRGELAESLRLPAYGEPLGTALAIAYRQKKIDFCASFAVTPPATTTERKQP